MKTVGDTLETFKVAGVKPGFNHPEENGVSAFEDITESSFPGKWKVIYFYPKDFERTHTRSLSGHLTASIEPGLYARISAHDLKRIVTNLIENARRYGRSQTDGRAYISLTTKQVGNLLVIEIADQGAGVAPDDIDRLLRPFARGELARTGVSGAGLGLAIVERLLGQVGGRLDLIPNTPTGLIARIEIPKVRIRSGLADSTSI